MAQEIIYTSAPQGLRPGTYGFCTVAATAGMVASFIEKLEALSGYRHLFPPGTPEASRNPVVYSHVVLKINVRRVHVLSRIADAGLDYTHRSNKLAHHVALDDNEAPAGGPAWLASQPSFLENSWTGAPRTLSSPRRVPLGTLPAQVCQTWEQLTGDAGWAGVLAQHAYDGRRPAYVIVPEGADVLALLREAQALLPERKRWDVSFSTCYTKMPAGVDCLWRCVIAGTPEAEAALALRGDLVIDASRRLGPAPEGRLVTAARTGQVPIEPTRSVAPSLDAPPEPAPVQLPARPAASSAPLVIEDEFAVGPPPMRDGFTPPTLPPPKAIAPPALKRRRSWVRMVSVAAGVLTIVGIFDGAYLYFTGQVDSFASNAAPPSADIGSRTEPDNAEASTTAPAKPDAPVEAPSNAKIVSASDDPTSDNRSTSSEAASSTPSQGKGPVQPPKEKKRELSNRDAQARNKEVNGETDSKSEKQKPTNPPPTDEPRLTRDMFPRFPLLAEDLPSIDSSVNERPNMEEAKCTLWSLSTPCKLSALTLYGGPNNNDMYFSVSQCTEEPSQWIVKQVILGNDTVVGRFNLEGNGTRLTFEWSPHADTNAYNNLQQCALLATLGKQELCFLFKQPPVHNPLQIRPHFEEQMDLLVSGNGEVSIEGISGAKKITSVAVRRGVLTTVDNQSRIGFLTQLKRSATSPDAFSLSTSVQLLSDTGDIIESFKQRYENASKLKRLTEHFSELTGQRQMLLSESARVQGEIEKPGNGSYKQGYINQQNDLKKGLGTVEKKLQRYNQYPEFKDSNFQEELRQLGRNWLDTQELPTISVTVYRVIRETNEDTTRTIKIPIHVFGDQMAEVVVQMAEAATPNEP